ncbi:MAG: tetratricopeptide repeat protein [Chitinophagales bacterium]
MSKEKDLQLARQYFEEGKALDKQAKYEEAVKVYEQASVLYEKWELWEEWVRVNNWIGWICKLLGAYEKGIELLQQVLEKGRGYLGEHHHVVAGSFYNLGVCYSSKWDYDLAINYFQNALDIYKKSLGQEHPDVMAFS